MHQYAVIRYAPDTQFERGIRTDEFDVVGYLQLDGAFHNGNQNAKVTSIAFFDELEFARAFAAKQAKDNPGVTFLVMTANECHMAHYQKVINKVSKFTEQGLLPA